MQGTLGLLSAIYGMQFYRECYNPLGDIMDMLALINCSTNFLLYCFMSTQFRETLCKMMKRKSPTVTDNPHTDLKSTEVYTLRKSPPVVIETPLDSLKSTEV